MSGLLIAHGFDWVQKESRAAFILWKLVTLLKLEAQSSSSKALILPISKQCLSSTNSRTGLVKTQSNPYLHSSRTKPLNKTSPALHSTVRSRRMMWWWKRLNTPSPTSRIKPISIKLTPTLLMKAKLFNNITLNNSKCRLEPRCLKKNLSFLLTPTWVNPSTEIGLSYASFATIKNVTQPSFLVDMLQPVLSVQRSVSSALYVASLT